MALVCGSRGLRLRLAVGLGTALIASSPRAQCQGADEAALIQRIDAANETRYANVLGFTDTEHYTVFRGGDEKTPTAQMTVKVTYRKGVGKSYEVVSQSGSKLILKFGLDPLLANEKAINEPAVVKNSWFTSANYDMKVERGETREIDSRACVALAIKPKRRAPNMIDGTLWVDARDGTIAAVEGESSKSPNPLAGTTHVMRQYTIIKGYSMARHARAESTSPVVGRTVVTIDYTDYQLTLQTRPGN